mgnify:CR=1 FL=1
MNNADIKWAHVELSTKCNAWCPACPRNKNGFGLIDGLVESVSGIYGRPQGYDVHDLADWTSTDDTLKYFQQLYTYVQSERKNLYQESWIQNQIDEIAQLIAETIYLLTLRG